MTAKSASWCIHFEQNKCMTLMFYGFIHKIISDTETNNL